MPPEIKVHQVELKFEDKNAEMIFYKRSGMGSGRQSIGDEEDYMDRLNSKSHPKADFGLSDYESGFWKFQWNWKVIFAT